MRRITAGLLLLLFALPAWAERAVVSSPRGGNLYSASGKKGQKLDILARNTEVETFEERDGRVRVKFAGGEGWVAKSVLRELPPGKAAPAAKKPEPKPEPAPKEAPQPAAVPVATPATPSAVPPAVSPSTPSTPPSTPSSAAAPAPAPDTGYLSQALKEEPAAKVETGPGLVTVLGSLFVVLALVAGAVYGVKLLAGRRLVGGARTKGIQVLATRPLGPRQALLLVEVGGVPLLLGQGEGMVNLISEIKDPEAVRRLNDLYGFRETPFETELKSRFDLEKDEELPRRPTPASGAPADADASDAGLSPEDRLAALRRRRRAGEDT